MPFPWDRSLKLVADYQAAQKAFDPTLTPDFVSLEGYLSGRLAAAALEKAGPQPTRASLLRAINDVGRFDISGSIVTVGVRMTDAPPKVFLTVIQKDGTFRAVDRLTERFEGCARGGLGVASARDGIGALPPPPCPPQGGRERRELCCRAQKVFKAGASSGRR